ncbi:hypothetical protein RM812_33370 [Streptomyces sp. DSM 40712]|uniref:Uncharacterized protein n=1 Tax=Streptomyces lancefieldiae TaxID=3075520 RepID=A0ABU3AY04_9ACTN|nr:hypothetical protein [Streptomyces sp. DSM 40712]
MTTVEDITARTGTAPEVDSVSAARRPAAERVAPQTIDTEETLSEYIPYTNDWCTDHRPGLTASAPDVLPS